MTKIISKGIRERDPTKWKVLKVEGEDTDDPVITFQAGTYVNSRGMEIPVIFHCAKSGIIYRTWKAEMERREKMAKIDSGVQQLEEGVVIDIETVVERTARMERGKPALEVHSEEDKKERSKIAQAKHWAKKKKEGESYDIVARLEQLRRDLRPMIYCNHEQYPCTGECKVTEEIMLLEKKLLGDPYNNEQLPES